MSPTTDPLLSFLLSLLDDEREKQMLELIYQGLPDQEILDALLRGKDGEDA